MNRKIYINGQYFDRENAKISVFDHGLLYGDGVFEGMRIYSGNVFRLQQHIERLWESARAIALTIPMSIEQLTDDVNATVKENGLNDGYIRLIVTRGAGPLGLDPFR
uniref:aminotransferase class IV n=1 Tax=Novipirellula sp. TaxID=2795430 RepID=UPI00356B1556